MTGLAMAPSNTPGGTMCKFFMDIRICFVRRHAEGIPRSWSFRDDCCVLFGPALISFALGEQSSPFWLQDSSVFNEIISERLDHDIKLLELCIVFECGNAVLSSFVCPGYFKFIDLDFACSVNCQYFNSSHIRSANSCN
jgi:hypothetical protein